ncbi:ABC transporter ATP-binding protein [Paenibacillus humicus]|uniref:ABC transporter ATP-binding protein n=1 Tax=Paenibacillus humicus TaxID=412861 RepID=UPI000FD836CE|nr:ATP-binding cassette domain-containing protein [Paenibacillus humicus]
MAREGLTARGVGKSFGAFEALGGVDVHAPEGKLTCLLGPSGCGKTTLLRILAGLEQPDRGEVALGGRSLTGVPASKRRFGFVFQSYALFPHMTAAGNIAYGLKGNMPRREIGARVDELLKLVRLEGVRDRYPAQLSGGQQQRVALARALALQPEVLLLDEPLSALDAKVRVMLREELCQLQEKLGITTVMVTHDQEEALTMADEIVVMNGGKVMQAGTPTDIYDRPADPFVAAFIGAVNFLPEWVGSASPDSRLAIRPEHVRIARADDIFDAARRELAAGAAERQPGGRRTAGCLLLAGRVEQAQFRGSSWRISVLLPHPSGGAEPALIHADLPAHEAAGLRLERGALLDLALPENRLLSYPSEACR